MFLLASVSAFPLARRNTGSQAIDPRLCGVSRRSGAHAAFGTDPSIARATASSTRSSHTKVSSLRTLSGMSSRSRRFRAGNIAVHAISVAFAERLAGGEDGFGLPFHRARKKVPHLDLASASPVDPTAPNAIKFETFVFDAMPLAERALVMETSRLERRG